MSSKKITIDKYFHKRLKAWIDKEPEITYDNFCKKVGISHGYLSMILSGKRGPSAELIAGIFINYRNKLHYLLTGEDNSKEIKIAEKEIPYGENKEEITKLLKMTAHVLTSNTEYKQSLSLNIRSFHQAVNDKHDFETRLATLEKKTSGNSRKAVKKDTPKNAPAGDATKQEAI